MNRINGFRLAALAAAGCAALLGGSALAQTKLVFNKFIPATHPYQTKIMDVWAKEVSEATKGRVVIEFTGSSLAPPPRQVDLVAGGGADLAFSFVGYNPDRFVRHGILSLPMLGPNAQSTTKAYWAMHDKHFAPGDEFRGLKLVGLWANMPGTIWTKTKVRKIEDYAGLKTRVGDRVLAKTVEAVGAVPVNTPGPQVYESVSRGVLNAATFPATDVLAFKIEAFVPNAVMYPGGLTAGSFFIAANPDKWASLSAEDRAAIEKLNGSVLGIKAAAAVDALEAEALPAIKAKGADLWTPDEAFMREAKARFAKVEAEWIKESKAEGFDGAAVLAEFRRLATQ